MKRKPKPIDRYQVSFAQEAFVDLFAVEIDIKTLAQFHKTVAV